MNMRTMLSEKGYDVYEGPLGMIDYSIVDTGRKIQQRCGRGKMVELLITEWDEEQVFIYSFFEDGFTIVRWVKKEAETR